MIIDDVLTCPVCESDMYIFNLDEINFNGSSGYYYFNCHCSNCDKDHYVRMKFNYYVTEAKVD